MACYLLEIQVNVKLTLTLPLTHHSHIVMGGIGESKFAFAENCNVDTKYDFQIIFFLINIKISHSTL